MKYLRKLRGVTPQDEPLVGQVANSAGGYSYPVDDWTRLSRFLVLGNDGGSYYAAERTLTRENALAVTRCIAADGGRAVAEIGAVSAAGRAPQNDPALFALALAATAADGETRRAALAALPQVARIGTHHALASDMFLKPEGASAHRSLAVLILAAVVGHNRAGHDGEQCGQTGVGDGEVKAYGQVIHRFHGVNKRNIGCKVRPKGRVFESLDAVNDISRREWRPMVKAHPFAQLERPDLPTFTGFPRRCQAWLKLPLGIEPHQWLVDVQNRIQIFQTKSLEHTATRNPVGKGDPQGSTALRRTGAGCLGRARRRCGCRRRLLGRRGTTRYQDQWGGRPAHQAQKCPSAQ